jgi:hypothetical protein
LTKSPWWSTTLPPAPQEEPEDRAVPKTQLNALRTWIAIRLSKSAGSSHRATCSGSRALEGPDETESSERTIENPKRPLVDEPAFQALLERVGGADRDRTDDLGFAKPALSQLSYSPTIHSLTSRTLGREPLGREPREISGPRGQREASDEPGRDGTIAPPTVPSERPPGWWA